MRSRRAGPTAAYLGRHTTAGREAGPWIGLVLALGALVVRASPAAAQPAKPEPLRLEFKGAPKCPDAGVLRDLVAADLGGQDPFVEEAPERLAIVLHRRGPAYFTADVTLYTAAGKAGLVTQEVANNCASLLNLVANTVAGWRMPVVVGRPKTSAPPACVPVEAPAPAPVCPPPAPAPRCEPEPTSQPTSAGPPDPPPPETKTPLVFRVGSGVWADYFSNDRGSLGLTLDMSIRRGWLSLIVEGRGDPPIGSTQIPNGGSVSFARVTGALLLCAHHNVLVGCLKGQGGRILFPSALPALPAQTYAAIGVRIGLEFPVVPWFLVRLDGELLPPIDPPTAVIHHQTLFQVAGWNAGLGLSTMFVMGKL